MKAFIHNGEVYLRCIPSKALFRSTMVHEVVNRGDIFAMNVNTQEFTIIPGKSEVEHIEGAFTKAPQQLQLVRNELERAFEPGDFVCKIGSAAKLQVRGYQWNHEFGEWQYSLRGFQSFTRESQLTKG